MALSLGRDVQQGRLLSLYRQGPLEACRLSAEREDWQEGAQDPHSFRAGTVQPSDIPALLEGEWNIAAALLTITPERQKQLAFAMGGQFLVDEVVVASKDVDGLTTLDELSGREHTRYLPRR